MKKLIYVLAISAAGLNSCLEEDFGPKQPGKETFAVSDFDRLEVGEAMEVRVEQGALFSVEAQGDQRNLNDLEVYKSGSTLVVRYLESRNRQYTTTITITMPELRGVNFSGAVNAQVTNFPITGRLEVNLSGASVAQLDVDGDEVYGNLSGASQLGLVGSAGSLSMEVSGASLLSAFTFPVDSVYLNLSGASIGKVSAERHIWAILTGASALSYRGEPIVEAQTSGGSTIAKD